MYSIDIKCSINSGELKQVPAVVIVPVLCTIVLLEDYEVFSTHREALNYTLVLSAAGDGLTNIMENHTFVPRARYLRLLRRRRRYELLYHSVLRLCSEFRGSRSFLWLDIKKSIRGKRSRIA